MRCRTSSLENWRVLITESNQLTIPRILALALLRRAIRRVLLFRPIQEIARRKVSVTRGDCRHEDEERDEDVHHQRRQ